MDRTPRFGEGPTAFGFLRLLFASLVIVGHTPELAGQGRRELLTRTIGGGLTFGGLAVSGFFIISGFLITSSYLNSGGGASYLSKRIARIYPAFVAMFLVCLFVIGPLGGGGADHANPADIFAQIRAIALLHAPDANGAFATLPYPSLNGAVWTIPYEFRCYLLVLALGSLGLLGRAKIIIALALACLLIAGLAPEPWLAQLGRMPLADLWLGWPKEAFRMTGLFLAGAAFYLLQRHILLRWELCALAAAGLLACLLVHPLANLGLAVFGAYLIFAAAQTGSATFLRKVNDRTDISYGLYLYAWPIEQLLLLTFGGSSLLLLGGATWVLAAACGWLSWTFVERPVLLWARGVGKRSERIMPVEPPSPLAIQ